VKKKKMKKKRAIDIGIIALSLLACSIGLVTAQEQSEEYVVITAPLSPEEGKDVYSIPTGSIIYHSADGITTIYTPDGKPILKARDSEAAMIPTPAGVVVPATYVLQSPSESSATFEPFEFYTDDRGWVSTESATKIYAPDGALISTVVRENTSALSQPPQFSGWIEDANNWSVDALDKFTAYWKAPCYPSSPEGNTVDFLFNAVEPDDGSGIIQPVLEWNNRGAPVWTAASWWGNKTIGYYWSSPIDVSVGDRLKGELEWYAASARWHIRITNLDSGDSTGYWAAEDFIGDTNLGVFATLEGCNVYDVTDVPGEATFYDMSFSYQGNPVDIEWEPWVNQSVKQDIPGLHVLVCSESKVKLLTRAIPKSDHKYNNVASKYPGPAYLNGSGFHSPGCIAEYKWNFGDGEVGYGERVEHKYKTYNWVGGSSGRYEPFDVSLTVKDNEGNTDTDYVDVNVYIAGDANGDGKVNILDAVWVGKHWRATCNGYNYVWDDEQADGADLNNDCRINILDAVIIGRNWRHTAW